MDKPSIEQAIRDIIVAIGEDPEREGLRDTPRRIAEMYEELFSGLREDPRELLEVGFDDEDHHEMVVVKDIPFYSMCVPSKQLVDAVGGQRRAADVNVGDWLYTIHEGTVRTTRVVAVSSRKTRELVRITPANSPSILLTPEHPVMTDTGWRPSEEVRKGDRVEKVVPHRYNQRRYSIREGFDLGYVLGAVAADASIQDGRRISLCGHTLPQRGRMIISSNSRFLDELGAVVESRPSRVGNGTMRLYVSDRWHQKGWYGRRGFEPSNGGFDLRDSTYVRVADVACVQTSGAKPYTVYTFTCDPFPTFSVSGVLTHNCEHHLLPFHGVAHVGYIPRGRILGISKVARLVEMLARRPQVQERLTSQIADFLCEGGLNAQGAAVVIDATHLCIEMRGIKKPGSRVVTSATRGIFREDARTRAEFFSIVEGKR